MLKWSNIAAGTVRHSDRAPHIMRMDFNLIRSLIQKPLVRLVALFFFGTLAAFILVRQLGNWLVAADALPAGLEVVCTFAGESRRVEYSKTLMLRYPGAHWLLSDYKNGHGRLLQKSNFDMQRVTIIDTCKNTIAEIDALQHWLDRTYPATHAAESGKETVLIRVGLVSSPYHMRRIKVMAGRRINRPDIRCYLLPVPLEEYQWNRDTFRYWWRSNVITSVTVLELLKIGYFLLTGYF